MKKPHVLLSSLVLILCFPCDGFCGQVHSQFFGDCEVTLETDEKWNGMAIRFRHPDLKNCALSKSRLAAFLDNAFEKLYHLDPGTDFESLFMGRIVEHPWIGRILSEKASNHPDWSKKDGKPLKGNINEFTAEILFSPEVVSVFEAPLEKAGFRVTAVGVEKVLVSTGKSEFADGGFEGEGKVPFDAMMWLIVERRTEPPSGNNQ